MFDKSTPSSIVDLLEQAGQKLLPASETAYLDAEVLLCHCLQKPRSFLRTWPEHQPSEPQLECFVDLIEQRSKGHPVAHLIGRREFWSREFCVTPEVLIPRPDSELIIELGLELLPLDRPSKVIDLGTGSGILAITLAAERPLADVIASDFSAAALQVARHNAERLATDNVRFRQAHWLDGLDETDFDLIVSNPPYIAADDPHLQQGDVRFEPQNALISPDDGLQDIEIIVEASRRHIRVDGTLLIEHGYNQLQPVQAIFSRHGYSRILTYRDLSGNPRVTSARWSPA
jgi:release factor glutamine methyltransferase